MIQKMKERIQILADVLLPICMYETCMFAMRPEYLVRHLKETHKWGSEDAGEICKGAMKEISDIQATPEQKALAESYLAEGNDNRDCILPCLPHLPVERGLRCPHCNYCATIMDTMRKHVQNKHTELLTDGNDCYSLLKSVNVQTIFGGSKKRWFEVSLAVQDAENDSCPIRYLTEFQGSLGASNLDEDVSHMNSFLSVSRFDQVLSGCGIPLETAWHLVRDSEQRDVETSRIFGAASRFYFSHAFSCYKKFPSLSSHSIQGTRLRLQLEPNTLERYESVVKQLLIFAHHAKALNETLVPLSVSRSLKEIIDSTCETEDTRIRVFHKFTVACFFDVIEPRKGETGFVGIFLACKNIMGGPSKDHLRYGDASEFTPTLAALKYCVRLIAVIEVSGYGETKSGVESWKFIESRTADQFIDTGSSYVAWLSHIAHSIHASEASKCRFRICRVHPRCGIIDGIELSLSGLGEIVRRIQKDAVSLLCQELLRGVEVEDQFFKDAGMLQDALQNRTKGFWFGVHPSNAKVTRNWQAMLWNNHGSVFWDREKNELKLETCAQFLESCELFQKKILMLIQLTSGAPSRATEIAVTRVVNDAIGGRNMFISDGQVVISTFYSKTRSMNDGASKPIARFPDAVTSGLILLYAMVVRPLEFCLVKAMAQATGGDTNVEEHRIYLFARRGRSLTGAHLCAWFKEAMGSVGLDNMAISQYRQFQAGMVKNFFRDDAGTDMHGLHAQAGHSEATAHRVYGVSEADFRHLTGTELEAYRAYSQRWQEALGVSHGPPRRFECSDPEKGSGPSGQSVPLSASSDNQGNLEAILTRLTKFEARMDEVLKLKASCERCKGIDDVDLGYKRGEYKRCKTVRAESRRSEERLFVEGEMHEALCAFLRIETTSACRYKSLEQKKAVETVRLGLTDAVVILPTGGGKSLTFMLPCYVEKNLITILIVPLVALQVDMMSRCAAAGIDAVNWGGRERVGARVIVISIEHVESEGYARFIQELHRTRRLARIVIDEAHLVLMWSSFRSSMHSVATCVRPHGVLVPVILLTATAPPRIVQMVAEMCGISKFNTIRSATFRPNIFYRVTNLEASAGKMALNLAVTGKVLEIIGKYRTESVESRVIVYVLRRAEVEALRSILSCDPETDAFQYHAGMCGTDRRTAQDSWCAKDVDGGKFKVMVATSAFGTGIDYPSIRAVIHVEGAPSLLQFVQESGRAGRDGLYSESVVLSLGKGGASFATGLGRSNSEVLQYEGKEKIADVRSNDAFGNFGYYLSQDVGCRRQILDSFCDGTPETPACARRSESGMQAVLCDICEESLSSPRSGALKQGLMIAKSGGTREGKQISGIESHQTTPDPCNGSRETTGICSIFASAAVAQGRRKKAELEAADLCNLARRLHDACPTCTVRSGIEVRHGTRGTGSFPCQKNRCDRCGIGGHGWQFCSLNPKPERNQGCARCGISKHGGIMVHVNGEFGKPVCSLKNVISVALHCWEEKTKRESLKKHHPELEQKYSIQEYAAWLRYTGTGARDGLSYAGIAIVAKWITRTFGAGASVDIRQNSAPEDNTEVAASSITGSQFTCRGI